MGSSEKEFNHQVGHSVYKSAIIDEENQFHRTRKPLYELLEQAFGKPIVSFYTSFDKKVVIDNNDAQMLEDLLQSIDLKDGFYLVINSPGGLAIAAERIINVCKSYSGTNSYKVIVPERAKSAASMICLGSDEIVVSKTSELGPVDPQIATANDDGYINRLSVKRLVESYKSLFDNAVSTNGNLEPYLQQLNNYSEAEINELEPHIQLSEEITIQALKDSMLENKGKDEIRDTMELFLEPGETKVHGRPIYINDMEECGLQLDERSVHSDEWNRIRELHIRLDNFVSKHAAKCIESKEESFVVTGE